MYKKTVSKFWNSRKQIIDFADEKPSKYLLGFFSKIKDSKDKKVLDVGCGGGRNTEMLLRFGFDVYGCDLHKGMVKITKKRVEKFGKDKAKKIIMASMFSLHYRTGTFDCVVSNCVFHNVYSIEELVIDIKESARVLKKHGKLALNVICSKIIDSQLKKVKNQKSTYITPSGLPMVLLSKKNLISILNKNNLYPITSITQTKTILDVGTRCVLKGFFEKVE